MSYTGLCVQRSIVEKYEDETRSTLVNELETEISNLEEQEIYFKKQVNSAPTDEAKKNAMNELRKTRIQLESKRTELIEKKGVNTVFDPMLGFLSQHPPSCSIRVWTDNRKALKSGAQTFSASTPNLSKCAYASACTCSVQSSLGFNTFAKPCVLVWNPSSP